MCISIQNWHITWIFVLCILWCTEYTFFSKHLHFLVLVSSSSLGPEEAEFTNIGYYNGTCSFYITTMLLLRYFYVIATKFTLHWIVYLLDQLYQHWICFCKWIFVVFPIYTKTLLLRYSYVDRSSLGPVLPELNI